MLIGYLNMLLVQDMGIFGRPSVLSYYNEFSKKTFRLKFIALLIVSKLAECDQLRLH